MADLTHIITRMTNAKTLDECNREYDILLANYVNSDMMAEAEKYYEARQEYNCSINGIILRFNSLVKAIASDISFKYCLIPMSSYPLTNLIHGSDYDLGLLVADLSMNKLRILTILLKNNGFSVGKVIINEHSPVYHFTPLHI